MSRSRWWIIGILLVGLLLTGCEERGVREERGDWRVPSPHPTPSMLKIVKTPGHMTQEAVK